MVHGFDLQFGWFQENDPIKNKFSLVHFTLPNASTNDYQWSFFWLPSKQVLPAQSISFNGATKTCSKQVRWLYYTNAKGARLWPLDAQTLAWLKLLNNDYNGLNIAGGIYTTCGTSGSTDIYSLYGQLTYTDNNGQLLGRLSAWFMYEPTTNKVKTGLGLYPSVQYFNNQTPLWYIYDSVAGIGFIGGQLDASGHQAVLSALENGSSINSTFWFGAGSGIVANVGGQTYSIESWVYAWLDTLWNISILGNVLLSRWGLDVTNRQSVLGNPSASSSVVFSDIVNTSDILNSLRKNSDALCRGQTKYNEDNGFNTNFLQWAASNADVVCIVNENGGSEYLTDQIPLTINLSNPNEYDWINIVVKWRNVILKGSVPNKQYSINLFVDNGNVYLDNGSFATEVVNNTANTGSYTVFDAQGNMIADYPGGGAHMILKTAYNNPNYQVPGWTNWVPLSAHKVYQQLLSAPSWGTGAAGIGRVNYGTYIRGNIFVNGILAWYNPLTQWPGATSNKYYFHGRLASLNTALVQSEKRNTFIQNLFGATEAPTIQQFVDFSKVFKWQCQLNGFATDANDQLTWQPCMVENDLFKFSPFILINTPITTKLLQ